MNHLHQQRQQLAGTYLIMGSGKADERNLNLLASMWKVVWKVFSGNRAPLEAEREVGVKNGSMKIEK